MENEVPESAGKILLNYLRELEEMELNTFKFSLENYPVEKGYSKIPRGDLKNAPALKIAELMINHYQAEYALQLAGHLLKDINRRDLAAKFQCDFQNYLAKGRREQYAIAQQIKEKFQEDFIKINNEQMDLFHSLCDINEEFVKSATEHVKHIEVSFPSLDRGLNAMDFKALGFCLKNSPGVEKVNINHIEIKPEDLRALIPGLMKCSSLWIMNCSLRDTCCTDLASLLKTNTSLTELDLSGNRLMDSGVRELCAGLKHPPCKIQRLLMMDCSLTGACCSDLSSVLKVNTSLKELHLSGNKLWDSGVKELCEGLKHPDCNIQRLVMDNCSLTASSCTDLSSVIKGNTTLSSLDLCNNTLGFSGVRELCEGLKHPACNIQQLVIIGCSLTESCCADLSSVLCTNKSLKDLHLNWNTLGDSGVRELCEAMKHSACTIQTLNLTHNELTDACTEALCSALGANPILRVLDLSDNHFTEKSAPLFREFKETWRTLNL